MSEKKAPRVAIIGVWLESNRQAPVATEADFKSFFQLEGDAILDAAREENPSILLEASAFVKTMDATGPWEPVPILVIGAEPGGPIEQAFFEDCVRRIVAGPGVLPVTLGVAANLSTRSMWGGRTSRRRTPPMAGLM